MKKKTFAVDIDGTITENGGGRIHLGALESLRRLTNMGHDVIYVLDVLLLKHIYFQFLGELKKLQLGKTAVVLH